MQFDLCVALLACSKVSAAVKATLHTIHSEETIDDGLSGWSLFLDGVIIVLPESKWVIFQTMPPP